jgi:protein-L-isoaspartate O-methyltransferase
MGLWRDRILPRLVDRALATPEVNARREMVCQGLQGRVLEIGFGSGLNVRYYPETVTEVLAVEPSELAWRLAQPRIQRVAAPVRRAGLNGERLELGRTRSIRHCPRTPSAPSRICRLRCSR